MPDRVDQQAQPLSTQGLEQRLAQLEQRLSQLEQGIDARITSGVESGINELTIQGQGCQVTGAGKTRTIIVTVPTGGSFSGNVDCDTLTVSGTVNLT